MSGSRKRLRKNGSTASSESGPPSWKSTTPTRRFFVEPRLGTLFLLALFQPVQVRAEIVSPFENAQEKHEEHAPSDQVRCEHAVEILHWASASRCSTSTSCLVRSKM